MHAKHRVVSRKKWLAARKQHLMKEKALTRILDVVARDRRQLPWVRVEKPYVDMENQPTHEQGWNGALDQLGRQLLQQTN